MLYAGVEPDSIWNAPGSSRALLHSKFIQQNAPGGDRTLNSTCAEQEKKDLNLYEQFWRLLCYHYIILLEAFARIRTVITGLQGRSSTIELQKQRAYNGTRTRTTCLEGRCAIHSHYICKCGFSKFARPLR